MSKNVSCATTRDAFQIGDKRDKTNPFFTEGLADDSTRVMMGINRVIDAVKLFIERLAN